MRDAGDVVGVLLQKRFVESILVADLHHLRFGDRLISGEEFSRVARSEVHHQKREDRDADQNGNRLKQTADDVRAQWRSQLALPVAWARQDTTMSAMAAPKRCGHCHTCYLK